MKNNIVDIVNNYLVDSENFANEFLPLRETLTPIQQDFKSALEELKQKSETATELSDKVFYLNRYTDLVKKVEGVFDTRSKRLQQTLSMLMKLPDVSDSTELQTDSNSDEFDNSNITPEQANEILKILNNKK